MEKWKFSDSLSSLKVHYYGLSSTYFILLFLWIYQVWYEENLIKLEQGLITFHFISLASESHSV